MKLATRQKLNIILNLFIFITTAIAVPVTLVFGSRATRIDGGDIPYWQHIVTFTILSNIFLGLTALITAIFNLHSLAKNKPVPSTINTWYLAASTAGMLTFLTVVLFLAPMRATRGQDYFDMLLEPMFFLHFLNPIISAIVIIFFSIQEKITVRPRLLATLPIVIYSIPYLLLVVILHVWPDFYGVTFGGKYYLTPLVFVVFWLVSFTIASLLSLFHNKNLKS